MSPVRSGRGLHERVEASGASLGRPCDAVLAVADLSCDGTDLILGPKHADAGWLVDGRTRRQLARRAAAGSPPHQRRHDHDDGYEYPNRKKDDRHRGPSFVHRTKSERPRRLRCTCQLPIEIHRYVLRLVVL